ILDFSLVFIKFILQLLLSDTLVSSTADFTLLIFESPGFNLFMTFGAMLFNLFNLFNNFSLAISIMNSFDLIKSAPNNSSFAKSSTITND
ncbi:unnamed protein product, partial [Rotaria magnacalcarata]